MPMRNPVKRMFWRIVNLCLYQSTAPIEIGSGFMATLTGIWCWLPWPAGMSLLTPLHTEMLSIVRWGTFLIIGGLCQFIGVSANMYNLRTFGAVWLLLTWSAICTRFFIFEPSRIIVPVLIALILKQVWVVVANTREIPDMASGDDH